mgnify:CR=1 FL=1
MAHELTVNATRANLSTSLVTSKSQPYSPAQFPQLSFGEQVGVNLFLTNGDEYDTRSGAAGYTPRIAITLDDQRPTGGTFTVSDGTDTTIAIEWDSTEAEIENALNAMNASAGPFGDLVTVQKLENGSFSVKFNTFGVKGVLSMDADGLDPMSTGVVAPLADGSASTRAKQFLQTRANPLLFADDAIVIPDGWSLTLDANNSNFFEAVADGEISADYEIQLISQDSSLDLLAVGPVILKRSSFDILSLAGISYPDLVSREDVVNQELSIVGLDGGTETDLDFIPTVALSVNYTVLTGVTIGPSVPGKTWSLQSGTDANDPAGGVVRPLDFDGTTNPKVWKVTQ